MRKIITFDLDGVIFPLVQYICAKHGINFQKVTCHNINHCSLLTREEQLSIIGEFGKERRTSIAAYLQEQKSSE